MNHYCLKFTGPLAQNNSNAANYAKASVNRMEARTLDVRADGPAWCCRFEGEDNLADIEVLASECSELCADVTTTVFVLTHQCAVAVEAIYAHGQFKGRYAYNKTESPQPYRRVCQEVLGDPCQIT